MTLKGHQNYSVYKMSWYVRYYLRKKSNTIIGQKYKALNAYQQNTIFQKNWT